MRLTKYRIVTDSYCGYEVQKWRIWFPFWMECSWANTHRSIESAQKFVELHKKNNVVWEDSNETTT